MRFYHIAFNQFKRRKLHMFFLIIGIVLGIGTLMTLLLITQAMERSLTKDLDSAGSRVLVLPMSRQASFEFEGVTLAQDVTYDAQVLPIEVMDTIQNIPAAEKIKAMAPRRLDTVEANGINMMLLGVDFDQEILLKPYWDIEGSYPKKSMQILLGRLAAESIGAAAGQEILIDSQAFIVTGILQELGDQDDLMGFVIFYEPSALSQDPEELSFLELSIETQGEADVLAEVVAQLSETIPEASIHSVREAVDLRRELVGQFRSSFLFLTVFMLCIASLSVGTSMQSSVNARRKELGILRAIGFRKKHIIKIIMLEANILSIFGGLLGFLAGTGSAWIIARSISDFELTIRTEPFLAFLSVLLSALIGSVSAFYPALRASSMDPAESLRQI